mgnify:CR=1 FL=1
MPDLTGSRPTDNGIKAPPQPREPWRRAQLVTELKAAGIDVDEVEENQKDDCCKE